MKRLLLTLIILLTCVNCNAQTAEKIDSKTVKYSYEVTIDQLLAIKAEIEDMIAQEKAKVDEKYADKLAKINAQIAEFNLITK